MSRIHIFVSFDSTDSNQHSGKISTALQGMIDSSLFATCPCHCENVQLTWMRKRLFWRDVSSEVNNVTCTFPLYAWYVMQASKHSSRLRRVFVSVAMYQFCTTWKVNKVCSLARWIFDSFVSAWQCWVVSSAISCEGVDFLPTGQKIGQPLQPILLQQWTPLFLTRLGIATYPPLPTLLGSIADTQRYCNILS